MFGAMVPQGNPLLMGCSPHVFLPISFFCGNKGFDALRMGPSGETDYWSIRPPPQDPLSLMPFLLRVGSRPVCRMWKVRQPPYGQERVTCIFISSACACDPRKGANLSGDSA